MIKACLLFFIKFLLIHQMINLQKLWKIFFISSKKPFSFSLPLLRLFDNLLSKYLTFKIISCMQWLLWVIYQNYKEVWTSFCYRFSAWFFFVLHLILHLWTRFQCHTFFPSQDIKQNVFLSSYLNNWWLHELWDLSLIIL